MTRSAHLLRLALLALVALSSSIGWVQRAEAQIRVGGGAVYTDLDPWNLGFQGNAYLALPNLPSLRIGGDIAYYLPESEGASVPGVGSARLEQNLLAANANAQLHLLVQERFSLYGLGGVNWSRASVSASGDLPGFPSGEETSTKTGVNLGAGIELGVGFGALYGEAKYIIASDDWGRMVIGAGVRFGPS